MVVVETALVSPDVAEGTSFMRLFRYISGSNEAEQKIANYDPPFMPSMLRRNEVWIRLDS